MAEDQVERFGDGPRNRAEHQGHCGAVRALLRISATVGTEAVPEQHEQQPDEPAERRTDAQLVLPLRQRTLAGSDKLCAESTHREDR